MKKYYNTIYNNDNIEILKQLPKNIVDLICIDPPYNIKKDKWDDIENYYDWLLERIKLSMKSLKPNGSFYIFHNDFLMLSNIVNRIINETTLEFKQFITWNKRFVDSKNKSFFDGYVHLTKNKNYQKLAEYCVYFTNTEYKASLNVYLQSIVKAIGNVRIINDFYGHRKYENTLCDVYLPIWYMMNKKLYIQLLCDFKEKLKEVELIEVNKLYHNLSLKYNNQKTVHSVWNVDIAKKEFHITTKPIELYDIIIKHSSDENDLCMDYFAGSGNFGMSCIKNKRNFLLIEKEKIYYDKIQQKINTQKRVYDNFKL